MNTASPATTRLFFQFLRETNWSVRPWKLPIGDHGRGLLDLIFYVPWPICLGKLTRKHRFYEIGLWPHLRPMDATVRPSDEQAMAAMLAEQGAELVPAHVLGATIAGRPRRWASKQRAFAQLGMVMVREYAHMMWHRTNFVFAAEIDRNGMAASLWMLQRPDLPPPDHLDGPMPQTYPFFESYPFFDLRVIANIPERRNQDRLQVLELYCGEEGWRQRTEEGRWEVIGPVGLDFVQRLEPVHFIRVVRFNSTGNFRHANWVRRNLTELSSASLIPTWNCLQYPDHQVHGCPEIYPNY